MARHDAFAHPLQQADKAVWAAAINTRFFPVMSMPKHPDMFAADMATWAIGAASISFLVNDAIRYRREPKHVQGDRDEYLLLSFSRQARLRFFQSGTELVCEPGQFLIERSGQPYDFYQESRGEVWCLRVASSALKHHVRCIDKFAPYAFDASSGIGKLLFDIVRTVPDQMQTIDERTSSGLGRIIIDILALALEGDDRVLGSRHGSIQKAHLARIERYVRQNLRDPHLDPAQIARANGISPRYLHELFRGTGTSVSRWILEQRLAACDADLRQGMRRETIAEIAYRWGFADAAHFSRHFKARYGSTPGEVRAEARGCGSP
jgi:AraC-like DNA-binding protein